MVLVVQCVACALVLVVSSSSFRCPKRCGISRMMENSTLKRVRRTSGAKHSVMCHHITCLSPLLHACTSRTSLLASRYRLSQGAVPRMGTSQSHACTLHHILLTHISGGNGEHATGMCMCMCRPCCMHSDTSDTLS